MGRKNHVRFWSGGEGVILSPTVTSSASAFYTVMTTFPFLCP